MWLSFSKRLGFANLRLEVYRGFGSFRRHASSLALAKKKLQDPT